MAFNVSTLTSIDGTVVTTGLQAEESSIIIISWISLVGRLVLWLFGTVGNALLFCLFSRPTMSQNPTGYLFRFLALCDLVTTQEHVEIFFTFSGIDLFSLNTWTCRFLYWIIQTAKVASAWTLVGIAVERVVGITVPHRVKVLFTLQRRKLFVCMNVAVSSLLSIHNLVGLDVDYYYDIVYGRPATLCRFSAGHPLLRFLLEKVFPWIEFCSYTMLPFFMLLLSNIIIVVSLYHAKRQRGDMVTSEGTKGGTNLTGLTAMLLSSSFAFLVFSMPWGIFLLMLLTFSIANWKLWLFSYLLVAANHSCNIVLYCLTGPTFRKEFKEMLSISK